jgi:hypothetical protein
MEPEQGADNFFKSSNFRALKVFHFHMFQQDMLENSILTRLNGYLPMAVFTPSCSLALPIHLFRGENEQLSG